MTHKLIKTGVDLPDNIFINKYNYFFLFYDAVFWSSSFKFFTFLKSFLTSINQSGFTISEFQPFKNEDLKIVFNEKSEGLFYNVMLTDNLILDENFLKGKINLKHFNHLTEYYLRECDEKIVHSDSEEWCLYASLVSELCILAISDNVISEFNSAYSQIKNDKSINHMDNLSEFTTWYKSLYPDKEDMRNFCNKLEENYKN